MRLLALTEGMPGRLRYYDPEKKLKDGLAEMISDGAAFMKPAETIFRESFRTPESYSALLHGMASGLHRLTDLSEYSGYAYNKCEKYLRAMIDAGFVITQRMDTGDGRTRKGYYLRSSYMMLWAKYFMTGIADTIDAAAKKYGMPGNYVAGANIAGFEKVAEAMLAQGVY